MERTIRILVQTTTPGGPDDWSVERLSLLTAHLASLRGEGACFDVTARNRESGPNGDDPVLASLDRSQYDELWLFALDTGGGLTAADCEGITRFRQRGGGIFSTRDHEDMGSSLCTLGGIGAAHYFRTRNPEPDSERHSPDDVETAIDLLAELSLRTQRRLPEDRPGRADTRTAACTDRVWPDRVVPSPPARRSGRCAARRTKRTGRGARNKPDKRSSIQSGCRLRAITRCPRQPSWTRGR